jgi:hypothetical protein
LRRVLFLLIASILLFASCASQKAALEKLRNDAGICDPPAYVLDPSLIPLKNPDEIIDKNLLSRYPHHILLVANAGGVLPDLKELHRMKQRIGVSGTNAEQLEYLSKKHKMLTRLMLLSSEISSVSAELDCEGERASQVAGYLSAFENRRIKNLTIWSITIGAIASVATSALNNKPGDESAIIGIVGGTASAVLGIRAFFSNSKAEFNHPRNLLAEIWNEPENSSLIPASIWYYFNEKRFTNSGEYSMCHNTKLRWESFGLIGTNAKENERIKALYFGKGGKYTAEELTTRANMLNQLQASVRLMSQDLQTLMLELSK